MVGTWNSTAPDGTKSVKKNRPILQTNTTYIESNMVLDHFWDEDANKDGHHKKIEMPDFGSNPSLSTGMDGVIYYKEVNGDVARVEGFYRNAQGIYQFIPSFLSGTHTVTGSFTTVVTLPPNVYGEVFMFRGIANGNQVGQAGFFRTSADVCEAWAYLINKRGSGSNFNLLFGNENDASGLNLRVSTASGVTPGSSWNYRITYRAT